MKPTPEESRSALMPFFWNTLAGKGVVLGDARRGSPMQVTNAFHKSYPGFSELLTGRAQDDVIRGNKLIQNPCFFGPDTPARGSIQRAGTFYHRDIAATALALLGIEPAVLPGMLGSPIPLAIT